MKPRQYIFLLSLIFSCLIFFQACQTKKSEAFGVVNGETIHFKDLSASDKNAVYDAKRQLYDTVSDILEKYYLNSWFLAYQKEHKIRTLDAAKKDFFYRKIVIKDQDIADFIQDNADQEEITKLSPQQRQVAVKDYLVRMAHRQLEQEIVQAAYDKNKIKIIAAEKPESPIVQFQKRGHVYNPKLLTPLYTIVMFADYQCGYCANAVPEIMKFIETHKNSVQYEFHDYPLTTKHEHAMSAAIAARCAEYQGKFWEMHKLIFSSSQDHRFINSGVFRLFAKQIDLDMTSFITCQNDPGQKAPIEADMREGVRAGVDANPTVFINGKRYHGPLTYDGLNTYIEADIKAAKR